MYIKQLSFLVVIIASLVATVGAARADQADDVYAVAARHYSSGRWELAAEELKRVLDDFPD
ncbi:MAG: hypothetical protein QF805_27215, partial [Pirellulaceae bacterium]|nr:hypothetical protein [Pirellulaceae bacterium]